MEWSGARSVSWGDGKGPPGGAGELDVGWALSWMWAHTRTPGHMPRIPGCLGFWTKGWVGGMAVFGHRLGEHMLRFQAAVTFRFRKVLRFGRTVHLP